MSAPKAAHGAGLAGTTATGPATRRWLRVAGVALGLGLARVRATPEGAAAVALVVSVDVSLSVDDARFRLQMEGVAAALEDPAVVAAITGNPGGILFAMATWADRANLALPWRRIATKADAAAASFRAVRRQAGDVTCLGQTMRTVTASVLPAPSTAW